MAFPTQTTFGDVIVGVGDGNSPEVFAEPCGFTSKSFDCDAASSTIVVPDCDDPDAPAWEIAGVTSMSWSVTGEGVMASEAYATWQAFFGKQRNVRIQLGAVGYWEGPAICTKLGHAVALGTDAGKVKLTINLRNAGAAIWHAGA